MQLPLLIKQLKHDDGEAFRQLFLTYSPRIYNYCRKFFSAKEDAEEIVQIVFTAVWENRLQIDENKPFSAYIFTIARNWIFNTLKKKAYFQRFIDYVLIQGNESNFLTEDEVIFNELHGIVEKCIGELPPRRREIFVLSRQNGLSYKEIARKLSVTESTVNTQITKSIDYIHRKLQTIY